MDLATLRERGERLSKVYSMENYRAKGEMRANTCFVHAETMEGEVRDPGWEQEGISGCRTVQYFFGGGEEKSFPKCIPCCIKIKQNPYMLKHPRIPPLIST